MKIIIVHHHLRKGGVTSVIKHQVQALAQYVNCDVRVVVGFSPTDSIGECKVECYPSLDYLNDEQNDRVKLLDNYLSILREMATDDTIFHVHNLNLGKNPVLTYAFYLLAKEGVQIINHAHDFSEDRPQNHSFLQSIIEGEFGVSLAEVLYPNYTNYSFIGINTVDCDRIKCLNSYVAVEYLPNSIELPSTAYDKNKARAIIEKDLGVSISQTLCVYPIRAITRKNIGEILLLSVLHPSVTFAITLPPENPAEIPQYEHWKQLSEELNLSVLFDVGLKSDFHTLLSATDYCITTSKMEGFGIAYLEPWLFNSPVIGRDLKNVTEDFRKSGVSFTNLYDQIQIPEYENDFATMDLETQTGIIKQLKSKAQLCESALQLNPKVVDLFKSISGETVLNNKDAIQKHYSLETYGKRLQSIYTRILT